MPKYASDREPTTRFLQTKLQGAQLLHHVLFIKQSTSKCLRNIIVPNTLFIDDGHIAAIPNQPTLLVTHMHLTS